jgi:hypothetical protein
MPQIENAIGSFEKVIQHLVLNIKTSKAQNQTASTIFTLRVKSKTQISSNTININ